ncbi:MAG: hypothetical protein ABIH23_18540 [bacterium]
MLTVCFLLAFAPGIWAQGTDEYDDRACIGDPSSRIWEITSTTGGATGWGVIAIDDLPAAITEEQPSEKVEVEQLTEEEWKLLTETKKAYVDALAKIRRAHGEQLRGYSGGSTPADCRGSQSTVEIRGKQAVRTTQFARRGGNPICF